MRCKGTKNISFHKFLEQIFSTWSQIYHPVTTQQMKYEHFSVTLQTGQLFKSWKQGRNKNIGVNYCIYHTFAFSLSALSSRANLISSLISSRVRSGNKPASAIALISRNAFTPSSWITSFWGFGTYFKRNAAKTNQL